MTSESLNERREDPSLNELVVDDLSLGRFTTIIGERSITIGELSSDRAVTDRDGSRSCENHSCLLNNVGTNISPTS